MASSAPIAPEKPKSLPDVGLYTPGDAAQYLRVPMGFFWELASPLDDRLGRWQHVDPLVADDDTPPADAVAVPRISFRTLTTLFVWTAAFDLLAEMRQRGTIARADRKKTEAEVHSRLAASVRSLIAFGSISVDELAAQLAQPYTGLTADAVRRLRGHLARRLNAIEVFNGEPTRIHLPVRGNSDALPRLLVIDPRVRFGRPMVVRTGTPVDVLFERYQAGDSMATLTEDYDLTAAEVEEAIRFMVPPQSLLQRDSDR